MRLKCRLFGCDFGGSWPYCDRCVVDLYDPSYVESGCISPILRAFSRLRWRFKGFMSPTCLQCGTRIGRLKYLKSDYSFCSKKCQDQWMPF